MTPERMQVKVAAGSTETIIFGSINLLSNVSIQLVARDSNNVAVRRFVLTHDTGANAMLALGDQSTMGSVAYTADALVDAGANLCLSLAVDTLDPAIQFWLTYTKENIYA